MDCEKFEPLLLDELYEELDELTSAAVKRHVSGCARCASILNGMKATRRAAALPIMAVPIGLEERILAAAKEAQKVVPIQSRFQRGVAIAGRWAMRPQTAMAAVFLLMIGTSAFLIKSKDVRSNKESAVSVTVEGSPAPVATLAQNDDLDPTAAASAHGPASPAWRAPPPPVATATPADEATGGQNAIVASLDDNKQLEKSKDNYGAITNAAAPAGAPAADPMTQQPMARAGKKDASDPYSLGAAAYQARNYAEAAKQFDLAAKTGDRNAELWAAQSVQDGQGCAMALGRFDSLAGKAAGSYIGNEASLRAAKCQIALGQTDAAQKRLAALQSDPAHAQQAQNALNDMNTQLAAKPGGGSAAGAGGAAAPRKAAAPPRPAAAAPARSPDNMMNERKASDYGF
jgi:hypothetical protein